MRALFAVHFRGNFLWIALKKNVEILTIKAPCHSSLRYTDTNSNRVLIMTDSNTRILRSEVDRLIDETSALSNGRHWVRFGAGVMFTLVVMSYTHLFL